MSIYLTKINREDMGRMLELFRTKRESCVARFGYDIKPVGGEYSHGFTAYYGCGHHLYFFTNDVEEKQLSNICSIRVEYPELMARDLQEIDPASLVVMIDCEMGGMSVW